MVKAIEKHITFYEAHDEVLKHIMETEFASIKSND